MIALGKENTQPKLKKANTFVTK